MSLTKAIFALEKLWRLGTPLPPRMLTIILGSFQTIIVFFFKKIVSYCNGHISTLPLFLLLLLSHQFCMYFTVFAFHYSLVKGCISTAESSCHHLKGYFVLGLKIVVS